MLDHALRVITEALPQLRQEPVRGRISGAEQRENADHRAPSELSRELESDRASGAVSSDDVRAVRPEDADLRGEVGGEVLDARERFAVSIEAGGLEPVEGLIGAEMLREGTVAKDVAVVPGHGKDGNAPPARL